MLKGTLLYVGNFELPDKGASANRVMTNRLLFEKVGYKTVYLGVVRGASFAGVRQSEYDFAVYERAYPNSISSWFRNAVSLRDVVGVSEKITDLKAVIFYNTTYALVKKAKKYFAKRNIKVIYDCTEWNPEAKGNAVKRMYKKHDYKKIIGDLENYADGMILVSSMMYEHYKGVPKILLPPLVDAEAPMWQVKRTRKDGMFEFCYAGAPEKKDDINALIEAFSKLDCPNKHLKIMGLTEEEYLKDFPCYDLKKVSFRGIVSHKKVIECLMNTDCFVFIRKPNLRNNAGFPTKFAEAYTSGASIIATDISDLKKYKENNIYILKDINTNKIVEMMEGAINGKSSPRLRHEFDYENFCEDMKKFLTRVID